MTKVAQPKTGRRPKKVGPAKVPRQKISAALAAVDQVKAQTPKAARVIALLQFWLSDETGYDEEAWPELKKALDQERARVGARRLFNG
jgi:hypothetical protein